MMTSEGSSSKLIYQAIPLPGNHEGEVDLSNTSMDNIPDPEAAVKHNLVELENEQDDNHHHPVGIDAEEESLLQDGNVDELERRLAGRLHLYRPQNITIEFYDLTFHTMVDANRQIATVSTALWKLLTFWKSTPKKRVNILTNATGRILPGKMTLLLGPPGSGKSVLLKALCDRLESAGKAKLSGDIYYDGDDIKSNQFLVGKIADYVEQGDTHQAVLTVDETLKFAWYCTTGGNHSYALAKDEEAATILDKSNAVFGRVHNTIAALGLNHCKDTYVGNAMVRGVSGGQKRRVTIGEMFSCARPVKMMDCITNGLDSATAYDIVKALKVMNVMLGRTEVISLLQPPPDVYNLFDEVILLCEGHIIYHGPREMAMSYFNSLGYECPFDVDEADFLQELPTPEGRRFIVKPGAPHRPSDLARAWKASTLYQTMLSEMRCTNAADAKVMSSSNNKVWYADYREKFPGSFWFYFILCLERELKVVVRDPAFFKARFGQSLFMGAIAGSLFNNIGTTETNTMNGFLFNTMLFLGFSSFSILPVVYQQKAVFYKQKESYFYPTAAFVFTQNMAVLPLQIIECLAYSIIVYWSAGLSDDYDGSRFLTFVTINLMFSILMGQFFRVLCSCIQEMKTCIPISGLLFVLMILFSGFIQPKSVISNGWIWFYWMNPISWALKALAINQYTSPRYNFLTCANEACTEQERFGDSILKANGNPTNQQYIWYAFSVLLGMNIFLFFLSYLAMEYVKSVPAPIPPMRDDEDKEEEEDSGERLISRNNVVVDVRSVKPLTTTTTAGNVEDDNNDIEAAAGGQAIQSDNNTNYNKIEQLPFEPISFAFKDIWYTVTLPSGEDIDLLKGVNGYFEPGTVTALMGSTGAGKTTLLDVLAGRKNTGVIRGEMYHNGILKVDAYFRRIMAYVEQFDTLHIKSTPREAIDFNASLRLPSSITVEQRHMWVNSILNMMDLLPIENELIGVTALGGMSFEQRKRVSIGTELAANPSILFLDEPTTGLDSRAAQVLIRNIRKIVSTGRTVVCTIHQPSSAIFHSFDNLLLLQTGGQTVYFGQLGQGSENLIRYFESIPARLLSSPMPNHCNPATWMLDVIGAGTTTTSSSNTRSPSATDIDFHLYYNESSLCQENMEKLTILTTTTTSNSRLNDENAMFVEGHHNNGYNTSYWKQLSLLYHRTIMTYWRTPSYTLSRNITNILIALIFASAYPLQDYTNYVETTSRAAVIYITSLFCGVLAMRTVIPIISEERPVYYLEQHARMYSPIVFSFVQSTVELPYVISGLFTLPFFFIVGFDNVGDITEKFFWAWFFNFFMQAVMLYLGILFVNLAPNEATTHVLSGLINALLGLFCGFLIPQQNYPPFWLFMYWLDPMHYVLEGLMTTQFHDDTTKITDENGQETTAEEYVFTHLFSKWSYDHLGYDILALCLFLGFSIVGSYFCLAYLRHQKR